MKELHEHITEIQALMEKIEADSSGAVTGVKMDRGCPSAVRERLQIAADTAQMNEKNIRARQEALKTQIEKAEKSGDTEGAAKMRGEYDRITDFRKTNLENMDRLESITSDYALKHKPGNNNYEQRAHALFLQKHRAKMEERMKEEEDSTFPNPDTIGKLQRRIARMDGAQKENEKWLAENDPKWLKAHQQAKLEPKDSVKQHNETLTTERKAREAAAKEAEKAAANGEAPAQQQAAEAKPQEGEAQDSGVRGPGSVWQTTNGQYGAINRGGVQKYFGSEEEAKVYAALEKGSRRTGENRKRKTAVSAETKASAPSAARKKVAKKLEVARGTRSKETASPGVTPTPPSRGKSTASFGTSKKSGYGKKTSRKTGFGKMNAGDLAADIVGNHLENLNEIYRDSGLGKWFKDESATKEPGWDRYNTAGKRVGKCGDAEEGEAYAACLSKQKADKLGKEGIASFVRRKRAAQKEAGMGKKGQGEAGGGAEPVRVSTGIDKVDEGWSQEYKDSIDCNNPKGFSQRAHCQGKEKNMEEQKQYTIADYEQGIEDLKALIEKHKKLADEAKAKGDTAAYRKHSGHVSEYYADIRTTKEMIKRAKRAEQMNEASENEPTNPELWDKVQDLVAGRTSSMEHGGETIEGPNGGKGFDVHPSAYSNAWAAKLYKRLGGGWRSVSESMQSAVSSIISNSLSKKLVTEEEKKEKPFKGFKRGVNHPEGGLSRAEAKRKGIHAGIETKDEAERKGGFSKLSPATQKRRASFCARMCGMKEKETSAEVAADPDSKINAALRVWGCRC